MYIYPTEEAAKEGRQVGGCGFLVLCALKACGDSSTEFFIVTNRHVIEKLTEPFVRINRQSGGFDVVQTNRNRWKSHPDGDDVAALPFHGLSDEHEFLAIPSDVFLTSSDIEDLDVGIGDQIAMIGRLIGHDGLVRNNPVARFGNIAMMPGDAIQNAFAHPQETFLVECHSIPGFSGSPVFLVLSQVTRSLGGIRLPGAGFKLLGIDWMHVSNKELVRSRIGDPLKDGQYVEANTGVAGVIPAWRLWKLLDSFK